MSMGLQRPPKDVPIPLAQNLPHGPVNFRFQLILQANVVTNFPAFKVPPGAIVTVSGMNRSGVNAAGAWIAQYPEALNPSLIPPATTAAQLVAPLAQVTVPWPVESLAEIWGMVVTNGDGLVVNIIGSAVG